MGLMKCARSPRSTMHSPMHRCSFRPRLEVLEDRAVPVIGSNAFAQLVPAGGDFDGVVRVFGAPGGGTGTLLYTGRHVLTAAHVVDADGTTGTLGADGPVTIQFDMIRNGTPIPVTWTVPANAITVHPNWGGTGNLNAGYDLAIIRLTDQVVAGSNRHVVSPFGAQRFSLFEGNASGRNFVQVGYGETGTGTTGNQSDEVQRVTINNPVPGGTFTLTFNGQTTAAIPQNATDVQVATALANLTNITANSVMVNTAGLPSSTWDVRFITITPPAPGGVGLGGQNVNQLTGAATGTATINIATQFNGAQPGISGVKRLGENTIDAIINVSPRDAQGNPTDPANNMVRYDFDNGLAAQNALGGLGLGAAREAFGARGDSGGPGFVWNNNRWEIAFVKSSIEGPGTTDLTVYRTAANNRRFDFSFGEINADALVPTFVNPFLTPTLTGPYHLVLDMNQQVLGNDGLTENLTITARRRMVGVVENLEIVVNNDSTPGAFSGVYFLAPMTEIQSLTLRGSGDNETFIIQSSLARPLTIDARDGADTIRLETLPAGISATLNGGSGHDRFQFTPALGDLNNLRGTVSIDGGEAFSDDEIWLNDANATGNNRTYRVTASAIQTPGNLATISYSRVGEIRVSAGSGNNPTANILGSQSGTNTLIEGATIINIGGPHTNPLISGTFTEFVQGRVEFRNAFRPMQLTITDTGNTTPRTITLEDRRVLGMTGGPIVFGSTLFGQNSRLSNLTINAGSGGNSVVVGNTLSPARVGSISLNTGLGADTVQVEEIHTPVTVNGQRGRDTVNIGRHGSVEGIAETLVVTNAGNWSEVNVDDRADTTPDVATLQFAGPYTQLVGLMPATGLIRLLSKDLSALNIWGGSGNNRFEVHTAPQSTFSNMQTTVHTGTGNDEITVYRTFGALNLDVQGGLNQIRIGSPTVGLNKIDGAVSVSGPGGINLLSVNDAPALVGNTYDLDEGRIQRTDKAAITYADIFGMDLRGGAGPDVFRVRSTELGAPFSLFGGGGTNTLDYSSLPMENQGIPALVSWYPGEGNATDIVSGNNGALLGNTGFTPGRIGEAFDFDGDGDYIRVPNAASLEPASVSVEAWVRSSSIGPTAYIVAKGASFNTAASYALYTGGGGLHFYIFDGSTFVLSPDAGPGIWDGQWHHVVGTFAGNHDGGMVRLYVDGAEIGAGTPSSITIGYNLPTSNDLFIGSYQGTSSYYYYFNGQIDEPSIYSRALNSAEVQNLFLNGKQIGTNGRGVTVNLPIGTATGFSGVYGIQNVIGTTANDIIVGNGGNLLIGGEGRDLLIAGTFASQLYGGTGEDLLIGGTLANPSLATLDAIMAEWALTGEGNDYFSRVSRLRANLLADGTITGNGGGNTLTGELDALDLFFGSLVADLQVVEGELAFPL